MATNETQNSKENKEKFAKRLKEAMARLGMNQVELAKASGITKSGITQYVSGKYEAKQEALHKLAVALKVNEAWLMGYDCPMERCGPELRNPDPTKASAIDPEAAKLSRLFDELNEEGRKVLLDYAGFLAAKSEYRKTPRASHTA